MQIFVFFTLLILSLGYFIREVYLRYRYTKLGRPDDRSDHPGKRWLMLIQNGLFGKKISKYPLNGVFHSFILWGFVVLLLSSIDMASVELFGVRIPLIGDNLWYTFIRDTFLLLVVLGVGFFALRRLLFKPDWLHNSLKAYGILLLIALIVISELLYLAFEVASGNQSLPSSAWLVLWFAGLLPNNLSPWISSIWWWVHFLGMFAFCLIIPRTKHLHFLFAPLNIYWASLEAKGAIQVVSMDDEEKQACGVKVLEDFTQKQLFDAFSCVLCGRCHGFCPSERSGEYLKPKKINGRLRTEMEKNLKLPKSERSQTAIVGKMFHFDFIWSCTTCGNCNAICPVSIDHLGKIIDMRRNIISENKQIAPELSAVCNGIAHAGNPWGKGRPSLSEFFGTESLYIPTIVENPQAEYLLYLGCQATFDESSRKAAMTFAQLMQSAGIDFAILDYQEWCCGESVRRLGHEFLFQKTAKQNIAHWNELGIKKIVTTCPHCFNTIKNEYPQFDGHFQVISHTTMLYDLWKNGHLKPTNVGKNQVNLERPLKVTFHDPCYLGRYNGIFQEPRLLLSATPGITLVEMPHTKNESFCCGAGGGRFWTREREDNPISVNRLKEAMATGADLIITACPYCYTTLLDQTRKQKLEENIITMDIVKFLWN